MLSSINLLSGCPRYLLTGVCLWFSAKGRLTACWRRKKRRRKKKRQKGLRRGNKEATFRDLRYISHLSKPSETALKPTVTPGSPAQQQNAGDSGLQRIVCDLNKSNLINMNNNNNGINKSISLLRRKT